MFGQHQHTDDAGQKSSTLLGLDELADSIDTVLDHKMYPLMGPKPRENNPKITDMVEMPPFMVKNGTYEYHVYRGEKHIQLKVINPQTKHIVRSHTLYRREEGWDYTGSSVPQFNDDYRRLENAAQQHK